MPKNLFIKRKLNSITTYLMVVLLIFAAQLKAQQTPINISITVTPPYNANFEDYVGLGANNVILNLTCSPTANGIQVFYLAGTLSQTGASSPFSIIAPVLPQPSFSHAITMSPGELLSLRGSDLQPYFDESRIVYENISQQQINTFYANKFIPEGNYQICLTAHDYDTQAPVSQATPSGCSNIFTIRNVDPPIISNPSCQLANDAGHIAAGAFQNINFLWNPPIGLPFNSNIAYTFQMVEVPIGMNPNQLFQNTSFIPFEVNTGNQTSFYYNASHPPLVIGKRYAIRVRAEDYSGTLLIRNEGYSEVCSFIYGLPNEIENFENATLIPTVNIISGAQLFYFEEFLEATNNVLRVQPAVSSNSSNITHPNDFTISATIKSTSNENEFEISTKREISIENILHFNTSNLQAVMYHGLDIAKAFGKFEQDKFTFTGNPELLRNYLVENDNKFILPPGQYTIEIQLMQANGITPVSQLSSFNFSVSYPHYIQNISIPPSMNVNIGNTLASSNAIAANLKSVAGGYTNVRLYNRFAVEIQSVNEINPSQQFKIKLITSAENCAIISNETNNGSNLSFEKLNCILKQFNAGEFKLQSGGSGNWINLPDEYISNGKLLLPDGNYKLFLKAYLKNSEIPLTDPNSGITFSTTGEAGTAFPLEVSTQLLGPVHGFKLWAERSESDEFKNISYIRNTITPVNAASGNNLTTKLRYKIEKTASSSAPAFVLKLKDSYQPNNEFIIGNVAQAVKYPDNLSAFGNFIQGNWEMVNSSDIPLSELFPNGELRLPPGEYKLFCWATNASGTIELSSPSAYTEFVLGPAFDYQLVNERTILPSGKLTEYYNVDPLPILKVTKTKDLSTAVFRTFASIKGISGPLSGKQFELKQTLMMDGAPIMLINGYHTHTYSDLATVMANSFATQFLLDGQAVPTNYTIGDANTNIDYLKLPPGSYEICYQTYSEKLHFKLGPDNGYCRTFEVDGSTLNASSEFNCEGTTPPDFELRAVYPAMNDTLPFRMFPFIVQFCPFSENFKGAEGTFRAHKTDGTLATIRTDISNNWPFGPQNAQYNVINGYISPGVYRVNPQIDITNERSTFLPVYENYQNALTFPETVFKRGESYYWYNELILRYKADSDAAETTRSKTVDNNSFGYGMTKPILNEPANNTTVAPGKIKFKFRKGRIPTNLLPPLDIVQTQLITGSGGHNVLTYDGIVNEAFVLQVSNQEDFDTILHSNTPVVINTSYRQMITFEDRSELIDLLYGNSEIEFEINSTGDYFWRVGWLNNPEDKNSGFYTISPAYKFTIGDPDELADIDITCGTAVTNTTFHSWSAAQLVNKNICIGKFTMQVKEIQENANQTYQGYGIIRWMDIPFKAVFSNIKLNASRQVYDGTARIERQVPTEVVNWIRTNMPQLDQAFTGGSAGVNNRPITNTSASIANQIFSISNLINGEATMPYGINLNVQDLEGQNRNFICAIMDMEFTKDDAKISTLLDLDVPHLSWLFELASTGVTINPNGFEGDYTLFLPKDKEMSISDDVKMAFSKCTYTSGSSTASPVFTNDGTYFKYKKASATSSAYWEAGLGVKLKIAATESKLLKEINEDDGFVTFQSQSIVTSGETGGYIFSFSAGEKFGFNDVPGLELSCNDLVLDLSTTANSSILTESKLRELMGDYYTLGTNKELLQGIYFKEIKGKYKKEFGSAELAFKDLLIDFGDGGFYGALAMNLGTVDLGGWKIKDNELGVKFQKNFKEAYLKGKIPLPIAAGDPLKYTCNIKKDENSTFGLNFIVETGEELNADVLMAKLQLHNSSVKVTIPFDESDAHFMVDLSGELTLKSESIPSSQLRAQMPSYPFEHLKLASKPFEGSEQVFSFLHVSKGNTESSGATGNSTARNAGPASASQDGSAHGFGATFSNLGLHVEPKSSSGSTLKAGLGIKFDLDLKIGPSGSNDDESTQFSVSAGGNIRIVGGDLTYNSNEGFGFDIAPSVSFGETFRVSGKIGPVSITEGSELSIYKASENPTMGDGVNIKLGVAIDLGADQIEGLMNAKFGNITKNNSAFKYFGLGIQVNLGSASIPIAPPFFLTGIGGGFAINMKSNSSPQTITQKTFESYSCGTGNPEMLGSFIPEIRNHYFYANATGNVKNNETFIACMEIQAAIENARLARLSIFGKGMLMPKDNRGIVEGVIDITLINTETMVAFDLNCLARTNAPIPGSSEVSLNINISKPRDSDATWYVLFGKPGAPNEITMAASIPGVGSITSSLKFYFLMGNDMVTAQAFDPEKKTPDLILNAFGGEVGSGNEAKRERVQQYFAAYQDNINRILGSESGLCGSTGGFAFGAEYSLDMDVSFLIIYFKFQLMLGFDLALLNYTSGCFDCGSDYPNPGMNNHYAMGQLYAGMHGDLGLQINLWFWKGRASLFKAYVAAMMQGGGPNPWWGKGGVVARGEVLGGLASINTEFKFSFGTQCTTPAFDITNIKVINEVLPSNGQDDVDIFTVPTVSFNNPVSEIKYTTTGINANTNRNADLTASKLKIFNVDYEDQNGEWVNRVFCFALNRFEMQEKPIVNGSFAAFANYSAGEGRPIIATDGMSAKLNMMNKTLMGDHQYRLVAEVEALERIDNNWASPNINQNAGQSVSRERRTESAGITSTHQFTTGEAPSSISNDFILYTTPLPDQNNFHPGDTQNERWSIVFKSAVPSYLNSKPMTLQNVESASNYRFTARYTAKFIDEDGQIVENTIPNFSESSLNWTGVLPKNMKSGKTYRLEIIKTWVGINPESQEALNGISELGDAYGRFIQRSYRAGSDTASIAIRDNKANPSISNSFTQSLVYALHFRVSKYNRFSDKLQALPLTASRSGAKIIYTSGNLASIEEPFDIFDVSRFRVFTGSQEEFPPLYSLTFLPQDNRANGIVSTKGTSALPSNYNGGMENLSKMYRDGFHFIRGNLLDLGANQGLIFRDNLLYHDNSGNNRQIPVRANPHSEDARFANQNNMLPYFPSGAIAYMYSGLKGRLSSSERYKGALSIYNPNGGSSSAVSVKGGNSLSNTSSGSMATNPNAAHVKITVEIQDVVNRDFKLYREILKKASDEANRLKLNGAGNSNQPLLDNNLLLISYSAKNHIDGSKISIGSSQFTLSASGYDFMIRLYATDPGAFSTFVRPTLAGTLNNMQFSLYGFELNRPGMHPQVVTTSENLFKSELNIQRPFVRMHHALQVYHTIFNKLNPSATMIDTYINSMGLNADDVFKNLSNLTFRIKYTGFNSQTGTYFNSSPALPTSGSLPNKGTVQFIKP